MIIQTALRGSGGSECTIRDRLSRYRSKPPVTNRIASCQSRHDWKHVGRVHTHDIGRLGVRQRILKMPSLILRDRIFEINDKPSIAWRLTSSGVFTRK